jgi:hypothetical protein
LQWSTERVSKAKSCVFEEIMEENNSVFNSFRDAWENERGLLSNRGEDDTETAKSKRVTNTKNGETILKVAEFLKFVLQYK